MIHADWISAIGDHLWQSTLLVGIAWLLTFALRKNHARARYWLWLVASMKFLVPFALLIAIGTHISWTATAPITSPAVSVVVEQMAHPFQPMQSVGGAILHSSAVEHRNILPVIFAFLWITGSLAVVLSWLRRWLRIRILIHRSTPLQLNAAVPVLSSPTLLEPGIFGVFRPVLLLPEGITARLDSEHLDAIIAHEMCHVRRRDNLAAVLHMIVEAVFWFHPLVWWIGSRLVEERERACDEEVLRLGNKPAVYAESILKTCQFYLESPLPCVSGITGSDLKKRIVRIMSAGFAESLSAGRKLLLVCTATAVIAVPLLFGLSRGSQSGSPAEANANAPLPKFEVVSVKPNHSGDARVRISNTPGRFSAVNVTPRMLIQFAYNIKGPELSGGPSWIDSERYDIDATTGETPDDVRREFPGMRGFNEQRRLQVQALLADRFKLVLSHQTKDLPIYVLVVAKDGPKFHQTAAAPPDSGDQDGSAPPPPGRVPSGRVGVMMRRGQLNMTGAPMSAFANALSDQLGRNVLDNTGLKGEYDLSLQWTPEEGQGQMFGGPAGGPEGRPAADSAPPPDASGPSIFTALEEQLGLKLESKKGPVQTLVIDHIERPSEN